MGRGWCLKGVGGTKMVGGRSGWDEKMKMWFERSAWLEGLGGMKGWFGRSG